ncbi:ThiF family adenylyltransferase [Actinacidiphila glaucinigra]|uniref:HesA/MoeB/ThiF family protein n=1 Tax=Actinacidiphila glaucinigra TaxID=235986 RepID=UPI0033EB98AC
MRITLKECVWETIGDALVVVFDPREAITLDDPGGMVAALLGELARTPQTVDELSHALRGQGFEVSEADVATGVQGLDQLGLVEAAEERGLGDAAADERHFSTLTFFGSYADLQRSRAEYMRRLRRSHALVLGVGGGGSSVVQCLAGLGVGEMTLLDSDVVESRNFARQFLYRNEDLGRSKVVRAAEWVQQYDPAITVHPVERRVSTPDDLVDLLEGVDIVVGGLDGDPDANLWINEAAVSRGVPYVLGGVSRTMLVYSSVDPGRSPCLACDQFDVPDHEEESVAGASIRLAVRHRPSNPLIAPIAMQVGSLIAYEALRYLTGFEPPRAAGRRVVLDLRTGLTAEWHRFTENPDCTVCVRAPRPVSAP